MAFHKRHINSILINKEKTIFTIKMNKTINKNDVNVLLDVVDFFQY